MPNTDMAIVYFNNGYCSVLDTIGTVPSQSDTYIDSDESQGCSVDVWIDQCELTPSSLRISFTRQAYTFDDRCDTAIPGVPTASQHCGLFEGFRCCKATSTWNCFTLGFR